VWNAAPAAVPFTVQGAAAQTGHLQDWVSNLGAVLAAVSPAGDFLLHGVPYVWPSAQGGANTTLRNDGAGNLSWQAAAGTTPAPANAAYAGPPSGAAALPTFRALVGADLPAALGYTNASQVWTQPQTFHALATSPAVAIQAVAGQSAVICAWQNAAGTTISWVDQNGVLGGNGSGLTGVPVTGLAGTLAISQGGTGQTTANAALNALLPAQTGLAGQALITDGANAHWTDAAAWNPGLSNFRLGLVSGNPLYTADATGGTLYLTPYGGNRIALYTGSRWKLYTLAELSVSVAGVGPGLPNDVWLFENAGSPVLAFTAWSSISARQATYALAYQDGVPVRGDNAGYRYLGTFATSSTGVAEDSVRRRLLYNYQNQRRRVLYATDATSSWIYSSTAVRAANANAASSGPNRVDLVVGTTDVELNLTLRSKVYTDTFGGVYVFLSEDLVGVQMPYNLTPDLALEPNTYNTVANVVHHHPALGYHYYQWCEAGCGSGTQTWYGQGTSGIVGSVNG